MDDCHDNKDDFNEWSKRMDKKIIVAIIESGDPDDHADHFEFKNKKDAMAFVKEIEAENPKVLWSMGEEQSNG